MWTITIYNPDNSVHGTAQSLTLTTPGSGSVTIPAMQYTCGFNHTLTGTQNGTNNMGGNGVSPWPDPGFAAEEKSPTGGDAPSWDATTGALPKPPK